jgi:hypothetical protein
VDERGGYVSLEQHVDLQYRALEKAMDLQFRAVKEAVEKSERATELRFQSVNEFRAQLGDQTRTLVPRPEVEQKFKSIDDKLDILAARLNTRDDKGRGMGEIWGYLIGAIGLIGAIYTIAKPT